MSTIKDVANLAGVSICTVSRVLSNKNYIKPETRDRVLDAARELQYLPNYSARSLKTGKTKTFGLILPDITNMYYPKIAKIIEEYAGKKGYMILLCNSDMSIKKEIQLIELLKKRAVDGVIALPISGEIGHFQSLADQGIPYVFINRDFANDPHCIPGDNFYAGYMITKYLIDRGHKNICVIFQPFSNPVYETRCQGARLALEESGLNDRFFLYDVGDMLQAHKQVVKLLKKRDRPTAFFAVNDMLAAGVYSAVYEQKLNIPADVSVVGCDNTLYASLMVPPLTTFQQQEHEMVQEAIEHLIAQMKGDNTVKPLDKMRGKLIERDSIATL